MWMKNVERGKMEGTCSVKTKNKLKRGGIKAKRAPENYVLL
jgi:hypothetical protein